jgi:hypothetical protein
MALVKIVEMSICHVLASCTTVTDCHYYILYRIDYNINVLLEFMHSCVDGLVETKTAFEKYHMMPNRQPDPSLASCARFSQILPEQVFTGVGPLSV